MGRMLVDMLIGGDDPLCMARYLLSQHAAAIIEAWSPEEKRVIVGQAARSGMRIIDHAIIGDYDLVLWLSPELAGCPHDYLVSINNAGNNPLDAATQQTKFKGKHTPLAELKNQIDIWLDLYGSLVIGSYVPKRNILYLKLFKRLFPGRVVSSYYTGDYKYGFRISK